MSAYVCTAATEMQQQQQLETGVRSRSGRLRRNSAPSDALGLAAQLPQLIPTQAQAQAFPHHPAFDADEMEMVGRGCMQGAWRMAHALRNVLGVYDAPTCVAPPIAGSPPPSCHHHRCTWHAPQNPSWLGWQVRDGSPVCRLRS